jgi:hypothetical protein
MPKRTVAAADEGLPNSDQLPVLVDGDHGLAVSRLKAAKALRPSMLDDEALGKFLAQLDENVSILQKKDFCRDTRPPGDSLSDEVIGLDRDGKKLKRFMMTSIRTKRGQIQEPRRRPLQGFCVRNHRLARTLLAQLDSSLDRERSALRRLPVEGCVMDDNDRIGILQDIVMAAKRIIAQGAKDGVDCKFSRELLAKCLRELDALGAAPLPEPPPARPWYLKRRPGDFNPNANHGRM